MLTRRLNSGPIVLQEQQLSDPFHLSQDAVSALMQFNLAVIEDGRPRKRRPVTPIPTPKSSHYRLQTNSIVGSFHAGGVDFNILPKAGVGRTVEFLAYGAGLAFWQSDLSRFEAAQTFTEALIPQFLREVNGILKIGLVEDYIAVEERGVTPRGRLEFDLLVRQGLPLPIDYSYDEFSLNTPFNRLLLRGLHEVTDIPSVDRSVKSAAKTAILDFSDVAFDSSPPPFSGREYLNPRYSHYRNAAILATLILDHLGLEPISGTRNARGLLFDMNRVYEAFVIAAVRNTTQKSLTIDVKGDFRKLFLDTKSTVPLYPDFSVWQGSKCLLFGDAKYKVLNRSDSAPTSDLYQMLSYATAGKCPKTLLFYTGETVRRDLIITNTQVKIAIRILDLSLSIAELEWIVAESISESLMFDA